MDFDVNEIIDKLSEEKLPLFVSERHFQVSFIMMAKSIYPKYSFIPEYVYFDEENNQELHIDLIVSFGEEKIAFEFKYITAGGVIKIPGNTNYQLKNHSASGIRKYQCIKDLSRLEKYLTDSQIKKGHFILITNMRYLWEEGREGLTAAEFNISDECTINAGMHTPQGETRFAREYGAIKLENKYKVRYKEYHRDPDFKYLIIDVC